MANNDPTKMTKANLLKYLQRNLDVSEWPESSWKKGQLLALYGEKFGNSAEAEVKPGEPALMGTYPAPSQQHVNFGGHFPTGDIHGNCDSHYIILRGQLLSVASSYSLFVTFARSCSHPLRTDSQPRGRRPGRRSKGRLQCPVSSKKCRMMSSAAP
jgi:hypothetical protein